MKPLHLIVQSIACALVVCAQLAFAVDPLTDTEKAKLSQVEKDAKRTPEMRKEAETYSNARKAYSEDRKKFPADRDPTSSKTYKAATATYDAALRKAMLQIDPSISTLLDKQAELKKLGLLNANEGETTADADSKRNDAMSPIQDKPGLPRVLLIGDSISIGYTLPVRERLKDKANVHRIPQNGGATEVGLEKIDAWLGDGKWDVIHFNFGLHDAKYASETTQRATREQYIQNLRKLIQRMQATGAKLIFATTTPVPNNGILSPTRKFDSVEQRNQLAVALMKENGVAIDDLYQAILPQQEKVGRPNDVHYSPEGYTILAAAVASRIEAELPK